MSLLKQTEISLDADLPADADLARTFAHWNEWRDGRPAPVWPDIDMTALPPALLPSTIVVDVVDRGQDLKFRYWGSAMVDLYGAELTGRRYSEIGEAMFGRLPYGQYRSVIETCAPRFFRVLIRRPTETIAERFNLRLPIIGADGGVAMVMTVAKINRRKIRQDIDIYDAIP